MSLRERIERLQRPPGLAVVRVGEDPASVIYVGRKARRAERLGFHQVSRFLPESTSQEELLSVIDKLNSDPLVDGILVQLPLPKHLDSDVVLESVIPTKDVDGFHAINAGMLCQGRLGMVPCTPKGVMALLASTGRDLTGLEAVIVGRSNIVGRPMVSLLEQANCTVTLCHSRTRDLAGHVRRADVLVAAVGRPNTIRGAWIKTGALVIDVGINRLEDGTICGDVETEEACYRAGAITPVPGGVGPMTIAMLMENTVLAAERAQDQSQLGAP